MRVFDVLLGLCAGTVTTLAGAFFNDWLARRRERRERLRTKYEAIYNTGIDGQTRIVELMTGVNDALGRERFEDFAREFRASLAHQELMTSLKTVHGQNLPIYLVESMFQLTPESWSDMTDLIIKMQGRLNELARLADVPPQVEVLAMDSKWMKDWQTRRQKQLTNGNTEDQATRNEPETSPTLLQVD